MFTFFVKLCAGFFHKFHYSVFFSVLYLIYVESSLEMKSSRLELSAISYFISLSLKIITKILYIYSTRSSLSHPFNHPLDR